MTIQHRLRNRLGARAESLKSKQRATTTPAGLPVKSGVKSGAGDTTEVDLEAASAAKHGSEQHNETLVRAPAGRRPAKGLRVKTRVKAGIHDAAGIEAEAEVELIARRGWAQHNETLVVT